jgi:hypothetical protein
MRGALVDALKNLGAAGAVRTATASGKLDVSEKHQHKGLTT